MDMRKVISAIVVAVVLVVGATVAYMYIADVGVFEKKEVEEEKDLKESTLGEFGESESNDEKDKDKETGSDKGDSVKEDDEDTNSDIVSALDSEEDTEVEVSNVEVTEGKDGTDRVTADTSNGNSIDVFVPGQTTGGEPVISEEPIGDGGERNEDGFLKDRLVNSGDNKNTEKVKDLIESAGAIYSGDVSTGSFGVYGNDIRHVFAEGEESDYRYRYSIGREDSNKSIELAADSMIRLGVKSSKSDIINAVKKAFKGEIVDFGNAWVVGDGLGATVRWN